MHPVFVPDSTRRRCKVCNRHDSEVGPISWRGYCSDHGPERERANNDQLRAHSGPFFEHWRRRGAAAYGAVLVDDLRGEG